MASESISPFPPDPAQRISQQFWNSEPAYSEAPPALNAEAAPVVVRDAKRGLFAKLLFVALFLPMLALLAHVVMNHVS